MDRINIKKAATIKDVKEITSFSRATIYKKMNDAGFPRPIKISPKRVIWDELKVRKWLDDQANKYTL